MEVGVGGLLIEFFVFGEQAMAPAGAGTAEATRGAAETSAQSRIQPSLDQFQALKIDAGVRPGSCKAKFDHMLVLGQVASGAGSPRSGEKRGFARRGGPRPTNGRDSAGPTGQRPVVADRVGSFN